MHQELLLAGTFKFTKKSPLEKPSLFVINMTSIMEKSVMLALYFKLLL